jgi:hypothetical protein
MAPLDRFIDKETQANTAQENAGASCMKIQREQFEHTARQNCNLPGVNNMDGELETTSTHSKDGANDDRVDNKGIYGGENDDDDGDFTYHSSDGSNEDDENGNEVLGNGTDGTSPTMSTCGKDGQSLIGGQLDNLPDWLHEIETNNTVNASLLLAAPITQVFLCIACKNIDNPATWISIFLQKTSNTTWEMFDEDFRKIGPKLDWNGDEGLKNLWGRYYRCPDAEFFQRALEARMQKDPPSLRVMHCIALAGSLVNSLLDAQRRLQKQTTTCTSLSQQPHPVPLHLSALL